MSELVVNLEPVIGISACCFRLLRRLFREFIDCPASAAKVRIASPGGHFNAEMSQHARQVCEVWCADFQAPDSKLSNGPEPYETALKIGALFLQK